MPLLSVFTPIGALELSDETPKAESIYWARVRALGYGQPDASFDFSEGSFADAFSYAAAMLDAGVAAYHERAADQAIPNRTHEALPIREREYGLVPAQGDTVIDRRRVYEARRLAPEGARYTNVVASLQALLGDDFVNYRVTHADEIVNWPTELGDAPMNLQPPEVPRKLLTIPGGVAVMGSQPVAYTIVEQPIDPLGNVVTDLLVGDVLVVEPGRLGREERVTVTAIDEGAGTFTATWTMAHEAGALATTMPFPLWTGNQRHSLVVVTESVAGDPETRRKIHELMQRLLRSTSTWQICAGAGTSTTGPFTVGESLLGIHSIGEVSLP